MSMRRVLRKRPVLLAGVPVAAMDPAAGMVPAGVAAVAEKVVLEVAAVAARGISAAAEGVEAVKEATAVPVAAVAAVAGTDSVFFPFCRDALFSARACG